MPKRYILNTIDQVAHDRHELHEECNTDQIVKRRNSDTVPKSYRLCQHCMKSPFEKSK